jgi:hypothetical protein
MTFASNTYAFVVNPCASNSVLAKRDGPFGLRNLNVPSSMCWVSVLAKHAAHQ